MIAFTPNKTDTRRSANVNFPVTIAEYDQLREDAKNHGISIAEFVRQAVNYARANMTPPVT